jgi:O-antigen/teichoic acid export membrane protein
VTIALQLLSIPVLLHAWGTDRYGSWIALTALPTYLALADLGFIQITASDMTMRVARNDRAGAFAMFQSTFLLICFVSCIVLSVAGLLIYFVPFARFLNASEPAASVAMVLGIMSAHVMLSLFSGLLAAAFRSEGHYARSVTLFATGRLVEGSAALAAAFLGGGLVAAAAAMLLARLVTMTIARILLRGAAPWAKLGFTAAQRSIIRGMIAPSAAFAAYTLGNMITLQGVVVAIAAALGPSTVAMFSTARTLARLGPTMANAISFPLQPEYSAAFGAKASNKFIRLFKQQSRVTLGLSLLYLVVLLTCGELVIELWTRNLVVVPYELLCLLAIGCALEILWTSLQTPLVATNQHHLMGSAYLLVSASGFLLLGSSLAHFGVLAIGWYTVTLGFFMSLIVAQQLRVFFRRNDLATLKGGTA